MNYLLIVLILLFYIFFFGRAYVLSHKLKKDIKAKDKILNLSILFAGLSSIVFLCFLLKLIALTLLFQSNICIIIGTVFIVFGIIISIVSSLSLKDSWRIGVCDNETTKLITSGIYKFSRNPYFLSFNIILVGMALYVASLYSIIPAVITITLFHILILREEKYLEQKHKNTYRKYKEKVGRYIWFIK